MVHNEMNKRPTPARRQTIILPRPQRLLFTNKYADLEMKEKALEAEEKNTTNDGAKDAEIGKEETKKQNRPKMSVDCLLDVMKKVDKFVETQQKGNSEKWRKLLNDTHVTHDRNEVKRLVHKELEKEFGGSSDAVQRFIGTVGMERKIIKAENKKVVKDHDTLTKIEWKK